MSEKDVVTSIRDLSADPTFIENIDQDFILSSEV